MGCKPSKSSSKGLSPVLPAAQAVANRDSVTQNKHGSSPSPGSSRDPIIPKSPPSPASPPESKRNTSTATALGIQKQHEVDPAMKEMFNTAYKKLTQDGEEMTKEKLKELFDSVDEKTFEDIYCLFDWDGDGSVDAREFVLTMCLLATPATTYDAEQDLLFAIFDNDGSGTIDRDEFGKMMKATLRCKRTHLDFCLKSADRQDAFRHHLEGEFSVEAIDFYQAVENFRGE